MPSTSKAQQRLMAAAEHGADFPMAKKLRKTMTHNQLHDFAVGSMTNKPEHVAPTPAPSPSPIQSFLSGNSPGVIGSNTSSFRNAGHSEYDATRRAIGLASNQAKPKGHPNRHLNLGKFLHKKKGT